MKGHLVKKVHPGSIADEIGLEPGDEVIKINDNNLEDVIDYYYLINEEFLEIFIKKHNNEEWIIEVEKDYDEILGVEFTLPLMNGIKRCQNNCIFCFINQLPPGMRNSLYFKDDDYRLSVFSGNYITLTNLTEEDLKKITGYRVSPLYISIHTTDLKLRKKMLNNEKAEFLLDYLKRFAKAGVEMYGQIVLCPGVNDGGYLEKTLYDLKSFWPQFRNVAIVPVGITAYRDDRLDLKSVDEQIANDIITMVKNFQAESLKELGTAFAFLADEFYLVAGQSIPDYEHYENFTQLENGVGLIRKFEKEINSALSNLTKKNDLNKTVSLVTGTSSKKFMEKMVEKIRKLDNSLNLIVHSITNEFFGEDVTVTGLITGQDIVNQLKGKFLGEYLLIPEVMLKDNEDLFLDDFPLKELEEVLNVKVIKIPVNGREFIECLLKL